MTFTTETGICTQYHRYSTQNGIGNSLLAGNYHISRLVCVFSVVSIAINGCQRRASQFETDITERSSAGGHIPLGD